MTVTDVNAVNQCERINVGKSHLDWHWWERNLKHLKKTEGGRKYPSDSPTEQSLSRQCALSPSVSLPFLFFFS